MGLAIACYLAATIATTIVVELRKDRPTALRCIGEMHGSDEIMNCTLFLGTYPGLTTEMLHHEIKTINEFVARKTDNQY